MSRGLEIRAAEITSDINARTLTARAVPYEEWTELYPGVSEQFARDALIPSELGIKLRLEHAETIGTITAFENRADGAYISARISETRAGEDAYTLLKDGALSSLSIGFKPLDGGSEYLFDRDTGETRIRRNFAELIEVSLVSFPAYKSAEVQNIRSIDNGESKMPARPTEPDLAEIRASLEENTRAISKLNSEMAAAAASNPAEMPFRSFGDYVKAVAAEDEAALRAYNGAVTGDDQTTRPAWLNRTIDRMTEKQRITNLFVHALDLPAEGMSVEFPTFGEDTLAVSKQAAQGSDLPYGKVTLATGSAPVITYGGYTTFSRQIVERSSALYLSTLFNRLALHYAKTVEQATRSLLEATIGARLDASPLKTSRSALTALTIDEIIGLIVDAVDLFDESDYPLDGLLVSKDVFKHLATLDQAPKALKFTTSTDENSQGTLTVAKLEGRLDSIPVNMGPGSGPYMAFHSREALEIHESPGAPLRLQDENIVNLTKSFSVYGYAAHYAPDTAALVPIGVKGA